MLGYLKGVLTCRSREEEGEELGEGEDMAQEDDVKGQRKRAPVIQEISLPNLPNPAPTDGMVLLPPQSTPY